MPGMISVYVFGPFRYPDGTLLYGIGPEKIFPGVSLFRKGPYIRGTKFRKMNIKFVLLFIIMLFTGIGTRIVNHIIAVDKSEKEYLFGEDSIRYEEVDGKKVHVMLTDGGFVRLDTLPLNIGYYFAVCELYNISDAEKVYAQSCLESGHFTSKRFRAANNHLGIKAGNRYASYDNWTQCLKAYADKVQCKKKTGEDHYAFLTRIGYAEDQEYISKVKSVVRSNRKRNRGFFEKP